MNDDAEKLLRFDPIYLSAVSIYNPVEFHDREINISWVVAEHLLEPLNNKEKENG